MKTAELEYELPPELIAQVPAERRDASRLMVVDRVSGTIRHERFDRLTEFLPPGCLLVMNDTRVLPARLRMRRKSGGGIHGLFLREIEPGLWELMLTSGRRLRPGELLDVKGEVPGEQGLRLVQRVGEGTWQARPEPPGAAEAILSRYGSAPLPPYIRRGTQPSGLPSSPDQQEQEQAGEIPAPQGSPAARQDRAADLERYQTVYARQPGAVAAPTAGLHFTPELLQRIAAMGIETAFVTLHVGIGTFAPIRVDDLAEHQMHAEWYDCPAATANAVNAARQSGRPVVAVGTTSVRVLESSADESGHVSAGSGWTRIFIYPPYRYRAVDALITNFHLPGSTLLALIFAMAGQELIQRAYREAVVERYRFFSYGDAMLIAASFSR